MNNPKAPIIGVNLLVLPYVDFNAGLPATGQTPIQWVQNGEWLGGSTTQTLNDGELNRVGVFLQRNISVVDKNTQLNQTSIDACIALVNIHEEILNAGGVDLPLYDRVSKIELDIGVVPSTETYRTVRKELTFQKDMMGNYENYNFDDVLSQGNPASGMKKLIALNASEIQINITDIETITDAIGTETTGILGDIETINTDLYGAGSAKTAVVGSLKAKVSGTGLDLSFDGMGCYTASKTLYEDYTTNGFVSGLPFGAVKDVAYTRAIVGTDTESSWVQIGRLPITLNSPLINASTENILSSVGNLIEHGNANSTHTINGVVNQNLVFANNVGISCTDSVGNVSDVLLMLAADKVNVGSSGYTTVINTSDNVLISVNGVAGSKVWCDSNAEAPTDGALYARKDSSWSKLDIHTYGTNAPDDSDGAPDGHLYFQIA